MADIITKILIRQGTDEQRRTANVTGVVFSSGEPGYCIDTKRLFIGDGSTSGGFPIGIQNLGSVNNLFGTWQNGFSFDAITIFNNKGASVGDLIYDKDTRGIYALTSVTTFPPLTTDLVKFDTATLVNNSQFVYDENNVLNIKNGGVGNQQLSLSIVDGITLFKPSYNAPLSIKTSGVTNLYLAQMPTNTVKVNNDYGTNNPTDLYVQPGQVVGRTNTSQLTSFNFDVILSEAVFSYQNGVIVDQTAVPPVFKLDTNIFDVQPTQFNILKQTTVNGNFTVTGTAQVNGTLRCTGDIVGYYVPSDLRLKENLSTIDNSINKVTSLAGYTFTFNSNAPEHLQGKQAVGLIAQDVQKVLPEAVEERGDGYKGVNYEAVVPLLVESIKELNNKVEKLENEIRIRS